MLSSDLLQDALRFLLRNRFPQNPQIPVLQNITIENFCGPAELQVPRSFLPLLLSTHSVELQSIFYSTGLYKFIPEAICDDLNLFGLPFAAILWVCSWFDPVENRAALYKSINYTRKCINFCAATFVKLSLLHLSIICNCSPAEECFQLLKQAGLDTTISVPLDSKEKTERLQVLIKSVGQLGLQQLQDLCKTVSQLQSVTPLGLAALLANKEYLKILAKNDTSETFVCLSYKPHSN